MKNYTIQYRDEQDFRDNSYEVFLAENSSEARSEFLNCKMVERGGVLDSIHIVDVHESTEAEAFIGGQLMMSYLR